MIKGLNRLARGGEQVRYIGAQTEWLAGGVGVVTGRQRKTWDGDVVYVNFVNCGRCGTTAVRVSNLELVGAAS